MRDESKLNDLAAGEIAAIERDGIKPTAADVVLLNSLAWAVECPETRRHLARGVPVPAGRAHLWPLTLRGADWLERVGGNLGPKLSSFALAYAMAHGHSDGSELDCEGREAARRVSAWGKTLHCTANQLIEAIEQVMAQESGPELPPKPDAPGMSVGDFSAFLAATNGASPEFWERRCSQGYAFAVLSAMVRQNAAEGKATAGDPRIEAERALGFAAEKIRHRANG